MKNNGTTTILNWALIAGAVALLVCGIKYYNKTKTVRSHQGLITKFGQIQNAQAVVSGLLAETQEYAKTHPAINSTLEQIVGQPAKAAPAATVKPAAAK